MPTAHKSYKDRLKIEELKQKLVKLIVTYSINLEKGDNVLIQFKSQDALQLATDISEEVLRQGGVPYTQGIYDEIEKVFINNASKEQMKGLNKIKTTLIKQIQANVIIAGAENSFEFSDTPNSLKTQSALINKELSEYRVNHTKWSLLRYPTPSMAQAAGMSTADFEKFFYEVCTVDYAKMDKAMDALESLMQKTDKVHLFGPETDLTFSIKGIKNIKCSGQFNIPDGEVFTAPVKDSVNGTIQYNTPTTYRGIKFENIKFVIKDGKIIEATSKGKDKELNEILDSDEGARYFGEFAIGVHPLILEPMNDTLFDEKIYGSIHLTPGNCYDEAPNGNKSSIHWDIVWIQRPEYGGGEIYFDDILIRKDGEFVLPELKGLSKENLL